MSVLLLVIDALNLVRRVYAAQPGEDTPERAQDGVKASLQSVRRALRQTQPTHAVCVFESAGNSWRHQRYPDYKAGRKPMPEPLAAVIPALQEDLLREGVPSYTIPGIEADDVVATFASKTTAHGGSAIILSTDKVFLQLLGDGVRVRDHFSEKELDEAHVQQKFNVRSDQLVDYFALVGDSTNNLSGVPGVGPKTAARLINAHGDLDAVLAAGEEIKGKLGERLCEHADLARTCRALMQLESDLRLGTHLRELRVILPAQDDLGG